MVTGYKLKFVTVRVNSRKKADGIIRALREEGRHAFYDEFFNLTAREYLVHYWTRKGVI